MQAQDLMTTNPACVTPDDSVQHVAQVMAECDCGCVPVVDSADTKRVVGVVTDRDIALRGVAKGKALNTPVGDLMTRTVACCSITADVKLVERAMADRQIRRIVVADADGCCVGIISQADLARAAAAQREFDEKERELAQVIERISEPG